MLLFLNHPSTYQIDLLLLQNNMPESSNNGGPHKIAHVSIIGNERIKTSYFAKEFAATGLNRRSFGNMDELQMALADRMEHMRSTDLFHTVDGSIRVPVKLVNGEETEALDFSKVHVQLEVKEKRIEHLITNVEGSMGGKSSVPLSAGMQAGFRSPFGYGEKIRIGADTVLRGLKLPRINYSASLDMPHVGPGLDDVSVTLARSTDDNRFYQSFQEVSDSITAQMKSRDGMRNYVSSFTVRDEVPSPHHSKVNPYMRDATSQIMATAASSTKFSIKTFNKWLDTRDVPSIPSRGSLLQSDLEVALPPGSAQFVKGEVSAQHTISLGPKILGEHGLVCTLSATAGLLVPFAAFTSGKKTTGQDGHSSQQQRNLRTYLSDRFVIGGPLNLRGFDPCGVGARSVGGREYLKGVDGSPSVSKTTAVDANSSDGAKSADPSIMDNIMERSLTGPKGDTLGGVSKLLVSAVFSAPLPFKDLSENSVFRGIRAIAFVNAGAMGSPDYWARRRYNLDNNNSLPSVPVLGPLRMSAGAGFCVNFMGNARMEMTYSVPLLKAQQDITRPFQIGVGLTVG